MPLTVSPSWNTLRNKPTTVAGFGISDLAANAVTSINGQVGAVTDTTFGAIGSYTVASLNTTVNTTYVEGSTYAASSLLRNSDGSNNSGMMTILGTSWDASNFAYPNGQASPAVAVGLSGTWRLVTRARNTWSNRMNLSGLFVRIA